MTGEVTGGVGARRWVLWWGVVVGGLLLIGGVVVGVNVWRESTVPKGAELLAAGDRVEAELRQRVFEVGLMIDPDTPFDAPYPDGTRQLFTEEIGLHACEGDSGFWFKVYRSFGNVEEWRFPEDQDAFRLRVADALVEAGWDNVTGTDYSGDIDVTNITARLPGVVDRLLIQFHPGVVADGVALRAEGVCHPGDKEELLNLRGDRAGNY